MTTPFVAVFRSTVITIFPKALWRIMEERKRLSDSGLFDLWEHACLLYHNFEWQSAADTFAYLAKVSSDPIDQRIFVLNRGLIEARLGDFDLASVSFEKALLLDGDDPVAHFLLGVVSVGLEDHYAGYVHLKRTLERLPADVLDYRTCGLDFGLSRSAVEADIERVRATLKSGKDRAGKATLTPICLHNIPAELIFEAPSRPGSISQEEQTSGDRHESSIASKSDAKSTRDPDVLATRRKSYSAVSTHPTVGVETIEIGFDPQLPSTAPLQSIPRKRLAPRDAQVRDGSTKELARFLRHEGPSSAANSTHLTASLETIEIGFDPKLPSIAPLRSLPPRKKLSARDAQIRDGSTKELARFLRHAGPSGAADITVDRLYLQRLMQGYSGLPTTSQVYDHNHDSSDAIGLAASSIPLQDDVESLMDLYIGNRPQRDPSPDGGRHLSVPKLVSRKPLPDAAAGPLIATGK
jgi:tetratricopeptide (TPR) repeat protein